MVDWQPIETGVIAGGVPDTNACHDGVEWWIEYKATGSGRVVLRPLQVAWINRRVRAGGRVWVAVRYMHAGGVRRGAPVDTLALVHGAHVVALAAGGLRTVPRVQWHGGPAGWHWAGVLACLLGGVAP